MRSLNVIRLVLDEQGYVLAISEAYETAGILHRDISAGNIMIDFNGRGLLNDWDHAGSRQDLAPAVVSFRLRGSQLCSLRYRVHGDLCLIHY